MRIVRLALMVLIATVGVAGADYPDGNFKTAQTRFGLLQVTGALGAMRINLNGTDLGIEDWSINIDGVYALEGGAHDWVLLTVHFGGNACTAPKMVLRLSNGAVTRTDTFGVCKGLAKDILFHPDAVEVVFSDSDPKVAQRVFRFDGVTLTDTPIAAGVAADTLAGGADVLRWLGRHPQNLLQDPGEQARLRRIMGPDGIDEMSRRMSGPGEIRQEGGWVVGRACQAHQCNAAAAAWAIRISDGVPFAIFYDRGGPGVFPPDVPLSDPVIENLLRWSLP
ncbi:hypothetical protein C8N43_1587 [Litoreibacter ponti]|uniref:Uncharacterized protein n=1 Tax=Litoreibacter ponti TaxID=1510457 RepID=A0A2T6BLJ2_9RHOB|nr:hypothetical protein [Litoreibacter ponti]PTX56922.1 hypothetical protein C8N43_1587 [Litoreibacter ponti]